jgi:prophage regulatory protein
MNTAHQTPEREIDRLVREPERRGFTGISLSTWYEMIARGVAPPAIKISPKCAVYPVSELRALNAARVAGKSEAEIKALVQRLVAARTRAFDRFETAAGAEAA